MAEDGTGATAGQADQGTPAATTLEAPKVASPGQPAGKMERTTASTGQSDTATPTGGPTQAAADEDSFFDPRDLDPSLVPAYKQMQKAFSKKMEAIKSSRQKIEAYDNFQKDPIATVQQLASQMGYRLTRAEAAEMAGQQAQQGTEPQTWDEVYSNAEKRARAAIMKELEPIIGQVAEVRRGNIERLLDDSCPDWRQYEDEMMATLKEHPSLVKDPAKLYQLSVPAEVRETQAYQRALKKLQGKTEAAKVAGTSTTKPQLTPIGNKSLSFSDAVAAAKAHLAEQGLRGPA